MQCFHWRATIGRKLYGIIVNEYENVPSVSNILRDFQITDVLMKNDTCCFMVSYVLRAPTFGRCLRDSFIRSMFDPLSCEVIVSTT
jgi:hypothetical protein